MGTSAVFPWCFGGVVLYFLVAIAAFSLVKLWFPSVALWGVVVLVVVVNFFFFVFVLGFLAWVRWCVFNFAPVCVNISLGFVIAQSVFFGDCVGYAHGCF